MKMLFLGNDCNLIKGLREDKRIKLIGVIADPVNDAEKKYFGSAREFAAQYGLPVVSMRVFKDNSRQLLASKFKSCTAIFSQGYQYKVPLELIDAVPKGIINFHQSMLPAYRGRHPLNWAIINGESSTGITFHFMNRNFDQGRVIFREKISIAKSDTVISLYNKTISAGLLMLPLVIGKIMAGERGALQSGNASYYPVRKPREGLLPENSQMMDAVNLVRALVYPYPGAYIFFHGRKVIIEQMEPSRLTKKSLLKFDRLFWVDKKLYMRLADGVARIIKIRSGNRIIIPEPCEFMSKQTA